MSNTTAGLITFLAYLVFLYMFFKLWKKTNLTSELTPRKFIRDYNSAPNWHARLAVVFVYSPLVLRYLFGTGLFGLASAGFVCIGAIFGGWNAEMLKVLRQMLLDSYDFIWRLLNPSPQDVPPVRPTPIAS